MAAGTNSTRDPEHLMVNAGQDIPELQPSWRKIAGLALVVLVLLALIYFSPLRAYLGRWTVPAEQTLLRDQIRSFGPLGPVVLMFGVALLVAVGVPRLIFCVVAGMAFGFWAGLLWAQLGTLLG